MPSFCVLFSTDRKDSLGLLNNISFVQPVANRNPGFGGHSPARKIISDLNRQHHHIKLEYTLTLAVYDTHTRSELIPKIEKRTRNRNTFYSIVIVTFEIIIIYRLRFSPYHNWGVLGILSRTECKLCVYQCYNNIIHDLSVRRLKRNCMPQSITTNIQLIFDIGLCSFRRELFRSIKYAFKTVYKF